MGLRLASTTRDPCEFRERAVHLLVTFFAIHDERERRFFFEEAFGPFDPNPARYIDFSGAVAPFAASAVDKLLAFGCAGRGEHALSVLLRTMATARGRQRHADYKEIPRALDEACALPTREEEHQYLARLIEEIEVKARLYYPLSGIANTRPELTGLEPWNDDRALKVYLLHQSRQHDAREQAPAREYGDILAAFEVVERAALLGAPGSGKSTTLRKLALELARQALADPKAPLPLLVSLGNWLGDQSLAEFLAEQAPEIGWAAEALCKANKLVLLLDGLNEVPAAKRAAKAAGVKSLCRKFEKLNPHAALFGSCRREDYAGELDLGLDTLTLEPLPPQRVRAALRQWMADCGQSEERADSLFWQLAGDERLSGVLKTWLAAGASEEAFWTVSSPQQEKQAYAKTSGEEDRLWSRHIPDPRSLLRLASNPFMLTMLFWVWRTEGKLPKNRGDLFGGFTDSLLGREKLLTLNAETNRTQSTEEGEQLLAGLAGLAWRMQTDRIAAGQSENGEFGVLTVVSRETAIQALASEDLLKKAQDCTLLEGTDDFRFRHQLLQEYFTARALRRNITEIRPEDLWPPERWWQRTGWEETAVLLAGLHAGDCSNIIRWLANAQPEVAAQCILESGAEIANRPALLRELQSAWLPRLTSLEREPAPESRAAIGRALGRLGLDNRKGTGLRPDGLPDIDWVEILGGEFLYGEGERRRIETFRMARYPVTNAQFQAFLDARDGYAGDRWWKGLDNPDRTPHLSSWSESNHPRETVSWYEAMAFCAWLGHNLKLDVRLPTEWQWERAARGRDGREYPWGNKYLSGYANIYETYQGGGNHYLARTSAVGIYPQAASLPPLEGVLDLAGNVWEWCLNEYEKPDRTKPGGERSRVLRGGSWGFNQGGARAGYRYGSRPGSRFNYIGFRVVVSSPIMKRSSPNR